MKNKVQLICYAERLSCNNEPGNIQALTTILNRQLKGVFGGVHLLPFYDSIHGSDAGFDPKDHLNVDPSLGSWADVERLGQSLELMADVIVNHISAHSPQFLDFKKNGEQSSYAKLFLTKEKIFGQPAPQDLVDKIYRPRPTPAFTAYTLEDGSSRLMWTTFTSEQIDIDVTQPEGIAYLDQIFQALARCHVKAIRLDAVGYAIKKSGTTCFMLPETFEFIERLSNSAQPLGIEVLVEVHSHYKTQIEIAKRVDWVYDFALPPLLLHAFHFGTAVALQEWVNIRPMNAVTVLDTHDGIGIIDIGAERSDRTGKPGLVPDSELDDLVESIHHASHGESRLATGTSASNLDLYQVNCTYYDALARNDEKYLMARAIQFFLPGIPQVYYVGLLAGHNDVELLQRTDVGRDINRHYFSGTELEHKLGEPVVQRLIDLIRFRNEHAAFGGRFRSESVDDTSIQLHWNNGTDFASLDVNFRTVTGCMSFSEGGSTRVVRFGHAQDELGSDATQEAVPVSAANTH